ncbi:uncharacterized protein C8Q71DRAFT_702070 [Rhodofomes roseus]|uniref:DUF4219 domain-containing protein n=1 Tax=Rhodofomes roseus TaxID=34475 RepID=A0ABQ8KRN1_9APHY|nr:uncharacterized protein C8Q71DRAFT_702070 [Rhodofomes roseus]KAH9840579.1 hypothetical protein C8Q71DRAFT_702070 [Rhodofomes roseus]
MPNETFKLDESNYAEWTVVMRALLVRKGLWDVTGGTDTVRPLGSPNSKVVKALETMYLARGFGTRLSLRRKFFVMKMSGTMQSWIADVATAAFRLEAAGVVVTDEDQILVLMNGLPDSYEGFTISLDSTSPSELTLDYTIIRLINEHERHMHVQAAEATATTTKTRASKDTGVAAAVLSSERL